MSYRARKWCRQQPIRFPEKTVLWYLCDAHNKDTGRCNPAAETIRKDLGIGDKMMRDALRRLRDAGLISWRRRFQKSSLYELHFDKATTAPIPKRKRRDRPTKHQNEVVDVDQFTVPSEVVDVRQFTPPCEVPSEVVDVQPNEVVAGGRVTLREPSLVGKFPAGLPLAGEFPAEYFEPQSQNPSPIAARASGTRVAARHAHDAKPTERKRPRKKRMPMIDYPITAADAQAKNDAIAHVPESERGPHYDEVQALMRKVARNFNPDYPRPKPDAPSSDEDEEARQGKDDPHGAV